MATTFENQIVRNNPHLFSLVCQFSFQPGRYIHAGHLTGVVPPAILERVRRSPRGQDRLSRWISTRWDLDAPVAGEFEDQPRRLALLEYTTLERLVSLMGAAVYCRRISLVVDRETQVRVKQSLGDDYAFAVKRAAFLVRDLPERLAQSIGSDPRGQLRDVGRACLLSCLHGASSALRKRLALKFPPDTPFAADETLSDDERSRVWKSLKRILVSEVKPEAAACFD